MKKSAILKRFMSVILCVIMVLTLSYTSFAKIVILDSWLPFETWTGSGTASVEFGDNYMTRDIREYVKFEDFEELSSREPDNKIDADDYIVSEVNGVTVITLKEEYLKTLEDNAYYFFAEFKNAEIPVVLYVVTEKVTLNTVVEFADWDWSEDSEPRAFLSSYDTSVFFSPALLDSVSYKGEKLDDSAYYLLFYGTGVTITMKKEYLRTLPTGIHYFDIEFMNVDGIMLKIEIPPVYALGDYNVDGKVTASDARSVLRIAANLDDAEESAEFIADIDADGKLTASDARRILRVAAELDVLNTVTVELEKDEIYEPALFVNNGQYMWFCDIPEESAINCETNGYIPNTDPFCIGGGAQKFSFSADTAGIYHIRMKKTLSWDSESTPIEEVHYIITVK